MFASKLKKANVSNVCNVLPWPSEKLSEFEVLPKGVGHLASMTEWRCHMSPVGRTIGWCGCSLLQHLAMYLGLKHFRIKFRIFLASHHHLSKSIAWLLLMQSACKSCSNLGSPWECPPGPQSRWLVSWSTFKPEKYKHYVHLIWFSNMFDVNHPGVLAVIAIVWAASVHPFQPSGNSSAWYCMNKYIAACTRKFRRDPQSTHVNPDPTCNGEVRRCPYPLSPPWWESKYEMWRKACTRRLWRLKW